MILKLPGTKAISFMKPAVTSTANCDLSLSSNHRNIYQREK